MVYSAGAGAELARVRCGGWRRQCACLIASPADFTFAFYRDRRIHLARRRQRATPACPQGMTSYNCFSTYLSGRSCRSANVVPHQKPSWLLYWKPWNTLYGCHRYLEVAEQFWPLVPCPS